MSGIGNRITALREQHGWSKTYVAKKLQMNLSTYANYEYGNREPDLSTINKLANLFNVSTDSLLGNGTNKSKADQVHNMTVDEALGTIMSFDGKPVTDHDKKVMKDLLESYLRNKE